MSNLSMDFLLLKRYSKRFSQVLGLISMLLFILLVIAIVCTELYHNYTFLIVVGLLFFIEFIIILIVFIPFNIKMNKYIIRIFGEVSEVDKINANELLKKWNIYRKDYSNMDLDFLYEQRYEDYDLVISNYLSTLTKGLKISSSNLKYLTDLNTNFSNYLHIEGIDDNVKGMITLYFEIFVLIKRNMYEEKIIITT